MSFYYWSMGADLFISYAWTTPEHREWVRLLASCLKAVGYDVLIDVDVDYGNDLNGFMRTAIECRHVLVVADENYVDRAENMPESGVGIETRWFSDVYWQKPPTWLSILYKDNPAFKRPSSMQASNTKGHSFKVNHEAQDVPGSYQIEDLWRWIEGLSANRDHMVSMATLRQRVKRLEEIDQLRDPNTWSNPSLNAEVCFKYNRSPRNIFSLGYGQFGFDIDISGCGADSVYVYRDHVHAVGINRTTTTEHQALGEQLSPGRTVTANVGDQVILQNKQGALCLVDILEVQREETSPTWVEAFVRFSYRVLLDT